MWICYGMYLYKHKKDVFNRYVSYEIVEFVALIPYFVLLMYYAAKRSIFVVAHEGTMQFFHIVDVVRNFFGATIIPNIYWPSVESYNITLLFSLLVVVPCVYFVYGLVKGIKIKDNFIRSLYKIFILCFFKN